MMLRSLLARPEVTEIYERRGSFGLMAFHGGNLERATDVIASEVAERTGSSYYGVVQASPFRRHIPSTRFDPDHSDDLRSFLDHVDTVIAVHGYGRDDRFCDVLLGGRNRHLAAHLADYLRAALPEHYGIIADLDQIPDGLRGQHGANPVNRPANAGVQIELPPPIRWNKEEANWSDHEGTPRAPHLALLIDGLSAAVEAWTGQDSARARLRVDVNRLRGEAIHGPTIAVATKPETIVQAVRPTLPELDQQR